MSTVAKIVTVVIVLAVVILLVIYRNKITAGIKKTPAIPVPAKPVTTTTPPPGSAGISSTTINYDKVLQIGSTGAEVQILQTWLGVNVDGNFGPQTLAALEVFANEDSITLNEFIAEYQVYQDESTKMASQNTLWDSVMNFLS